VVIVAQLKVEEFCHPDLRCGAAQFLADDDILVIASSGVDAFIGPIGAATLSTSLPFVSSNH
jgi:hypothetical protein